MSPSVNPISNNVRRLLSVLLIVLVVMAILPWLIPTSKIGGFILSMYGIPNYLPGDHQAFGDPMYAFKGITRLLGIVGSSISLLPSLLATRVMLKVCQHYSLNNIFSADNAHAYSKLGLLYLLSALVLQPISQMFFSYAISTDNPLGHHYISFGVDISNLSAIFFSILLIIIGQVMKLGHRMAQEQELTI